MTLPAPVQLFLDFAALLRGHRFAVAPDQTIGWIEAIGLLGPRDISEIRRTAIAMLAIPNDRKDEFDALFQSFFHGQTVAAKALASDDDEVDAFEATGGETQTEEAAEEDEQPGLDATTAERLTRRGFSGEYDDAALARFARQATRHLPRRRSYRRAPARRGETLDMRRVLREAVRRDGEVFNLPRRQRKLRQRKILLLIDVSGSMTERSEGMMRFGHALARSSERFEAFTLGTRLTRVTRALNIREQRRALEQVGALVADFDGGTRIGEALQTLLAVPRYAGFVRGAATVVLSDGLERGDSAAMVDAVQRLSRLAWRLVWLSPLVGRDGYTPQTEALIEILPYLDQLSDGGSIDAICAHVLRLARAV